MNKLQSVVILPTRDDQQALLGYIAYVRFQDSKDDCDISAWSKPYLYHEIERVARNAQ